MTFQELLKQRVGSGDDQIPTRKFAERIGVHRTIVTRYQGGISLPEYERVQRIADVLRLDGAKLWKIVQREKTERDMDRHIAFLSSKSDIFEVIQDLSLADRKLIGRLVNILATGNPEIRRALHRVVDGMAYKDGRPKSR